MPVPYAGAYTFQITITKTYNVTNLFEDLKTLYKMAGLKGRKVHSFKGTSVSTCVSQATLDECRPPSFAA